MAEINTVQVQVAANASSSYKVAKEEYHPSYSYEDATLVVVSSDDIKFKVHPLILGMASEIFRDMMTHANDTGEAIHLRERALVVKTLLDLVYPNAKRVSSSNLDFTLIWNLLIAADKYGFSRVLEEFHDRAMNESYFLERPLEAFIIGARYGWSDVLLKSTLGAIDEIASESKGNLSYRNLTRLDSVYLLKLHKYASVRKIIIREAIDKEIKEVYDEEVGFLMNAGEDEHWNTFEYPKAHKAIMESVDFNLQTCPSGRSLQKIWDYHNLKEYIDHERRYRYNRAIDDALKKFPESADEVSFGQLEKSFDG